MLVHSSILPPAGDLPIFDYAMLAIVAVFTILGLVKGMAWQLSRLLILIAGYTAAITFAGHLAPVFDRFVPLDVDPELATHAARFTLFLVTIVALAVFAWFVHRPKEPPLLSPRSRLLGGMLGVAAGALVALAILTSIGMFLPGRRVAMAAEKSASAVFSQRALDAVGRILPSNLRPSVDRWRLLIGHSVFDGTTAPHSTVDPLDPDEVPGGGAERDGDPVDGSFRPSDGSDRTPSPHKRIDQKRR